MKALDTSVLLALLEGDSRARDLVAHLHSVELATTEANMLELAWIASQGPPRVAAARRIQLDRLRRRITVLPLDDKAMERTTHALRRGIGKRPTPLVLAMLGALEANGCDELFSQDAKLGDGRWSFRVTNLIRQVTK
jgi:predicted nucleic acid-binding protein